MADETATISDNTTEPTEQDDSRLLDDLLEKAGAEHGN